MSDFNIWKVTQTGSDPPSAPDENDCERTEPHGRYLERDIRTPHRIFMPPSTLLLQPLEKGKVVVCHSLTLRQRRSFIGDPGRIELW